MIILIKAICVILFVLILIFLINPALMRKYLLFWTQGKNIYLGAFIRFILAGIFLLAASEASIPIVFYLIGFLGIFGGILLLLMPSRFYPMLNWFAARSNTVIRLWCLIACAIIGLLYYAA